MSTFIKLSRYPFLNEHIPEDKTSTLTANFMLKTCKHRNKNVKFLKA